MQCIHNVIRTFAAIAAAVFSGGAFGQANTDAERPPKAAPRFEDFRVPTPIPARKQRAEIANRPLASENELAKVAKEGPDFAGHFVAERWTCGSLCTGFAIVDVQTGTVYSVPFNVSYFCPDSDIATELAYRLDSRLLVVNGAIETYDPKKGEVDGPCGKFYYEWDGHALKLISTVVPVEPSFKPPGSALME